MDYSWAQPAAVRPPAARQSDGVPQVREDSMATLEPPLPQGLRTADRAGLVPGGSAPSPVHLPSFLAAPVHMPSTRGRRLEWKRKTVGRGRLRAADVALASIRWRPV